MNEPPSQCRKKKQALRDIEAKGITLEKSFELGAEESIIERQLGFLPTNVHSVAARSESGTYECMNVLRSKSCSLHRVPCGVRSL